MIHVHATISVQPGRREEFLAEFHKLVPEVLAEDGCLEYGPTVDFQTSIPVQGEAREDVVVVVEKWESAETLEVHLMAPHMMEFRTRTRDLVVGMELQVLQPA